MPYNMPTEAAGAQSANEAASSSVAPKDAVQDNSSQRKRPRKRKRGNREDKDDADVSLPLEKQPLYTPWLASLGPTIAADETKEERLHGEIVGYAGYILPTTQEKRARDRLISRIENVLKRRFPDGTIHVYGSVSTNLCLPTGDVDVVIETRGVTTAEQMKNGLYQVRNMLQRADLADSIFVVARARVPVINMVSTPETGSFNIDITINGLEGVQAISIVKDYLAQMPALRYLILVLKCLFEQHNLHSAATGGLSSYALTCMVVSFLQLNPAKRSKEFLEQPIKSKSLGVLLMDLLKYYGDDFPYTESCISVRSAELKSKEAKGWIDENQPGKLSIECLVYPENDVAKSTGRIRQMQELFQASYKSLAEASLQSTTNNLLGTIVRLSQETLDRRERLREIGESRDYGQSSHAGYHRQESSYHRQPPYDYQQRNYHRPPQPAYHRYGQASSSRDQSYYPNKRPRR